jgi:hypothetical protein
VKKSELGNAKRGGNLKESRKKKGKLIRGLGDMVFRLIYRPLDLCVGRLSLNLVTVPLLSR